MLLTQYMGNPFKCIILWNKICTGRNVQFIDVQKCKSGALMQITIIYRALELSACHFFPIFS